MYFLLQCQEIQTNFVFCVNYINYWKSKLTVFGHNCSVTVVDRLVVASRQRSTGTAAFIQAPIAEQTFSTASLTGRS